jgi:hypothetical protein
MPPKSALKPLPDEVPVPLHVGENVALHDDHKKHPGMYGRIEAVGVDPTDDGLKIDLRIYDPTVGPADNDKSYRATMGEIQ